MSPFDRDTHSLVDILRFVLTLSRRRRNAKKPPSLQMNLFLDTCRKAFVAWLSNLADKTVLALCLNDDISKKLAAPALLYKSPRKRKYVHVSAEAKWSVLEAAKKARASEKTIIFARSNTSDTTIADTTLGSETK